MSLRLLIVCVSQCHYRSLKVMCSPESTPHKVVRRTLFATCLFVACVMRCFWDLHRATELELLHAFNAVDFVYEAGLLPHISPSTPSKWLASEEVLDEMHALQNYIQSLASADERQNSNVHLLAALSQDETSSRKSNSIILSIMATGDLKKKNKDKL